MDESIQSDLQNLSLVVRKACFGLPTACPSCLPVYIYLKFANVAFDLSYNLTFPDSDQIPYIDTDTYVAYNNEKGGVIESLKEDNIVNLDSGVQNLPEWVSTLAMINSWLSDALLYELWVSSDGSSAHKIYYSDLPWPIGKLLYLKQVRNVKQLLGISKENAERREEEIYRRATIAYQALSTKLGEESFFSDNRQVQTYYIILATSLDAFFLGHALITLAIKVGNGPNKDVVLPEGVGLKGDVWFAKWNWIPLKELEWNLMEFDHIFGWYMETSVLRGKLLEQANLVKYADKHKAELLDAGSSSSNPSSSSVPRRGPSNWGSKPKSQPKKERTEEEKSFRRKAKYFLVTQMVAVLVFLSLLGGSDDTEVDVDGDGDGGGFDYGN
ncbi:hypothetical protein OSB04_007812 [Centaurea solstitialis]|uniref:Thioredoxin-like fold domain-containing protein n=1 Tax=Centaurea solstitialis TaxID=347529 RepID=A0AA38WIX1_9ASTR|nr:hypothetical protein OSB04_007812 [Centaurea solstitialis]